MEIEELTVEERIKLVEDIWDSIAAEQKKLPLTREQRKLLDGRLEEYKLDGDPGTPGFEVVKRIRNRL
ncbi:MAG: addiction module protein [Chloroflexi bacterium]|nr:addiction module protein [Chloroflexota bacterium]